jgi:hypothetical protein
MPTITRAAGPAPIQSIQSSPAEALKRFEGAFKLNPTPNGANGMAPMVIKAVPGGLEVTQMNTNGSKGETYKVRGTPTENGGKLTLKSSGPEEAKRGEKRFGTYEVSIKGDQMHFDMKQTHDYGGWLSKSRTEASRTADFTRVP